MSVVPVVGQQATCPYEPPRQNSIALDESLIGFYLNCKKCPKESDMTVDEITAMWNEINAVFQSGVDLFNSLVVGNRFWVQPGNGNSHRFLRAVAHPDEFDANGDRRLVDNCAGCTTRACKKKWCSGGGRRRLQDEQHEGRHLSLETRNLMRVELANMLACIPDLTYEYQFAVTDESK